MRKIYYCFASLFISIAGSAQDPAFFDPNQALLYLNPSFAGSNGCFRARGCVIAQDTKADEAYVTVFSSADFYLKGIKAGIAISHFVDYEGAGRTNTFSKGITYAQHLGFLNNALKIIPSVQLDFGKRRYQLAKLQYGSVIDPRLDIYWNTAEVVPSASKLYVDMNAGLLANYKNKLYAGVSVFHLNQPDGGVLGAFPLPARITVHAAYNLQRNERTLFNFSGMYVKQSSYHSVQLNANAIFFKYLSCGLGYQSNPHLFDDALLANIGFKGNFIAVAINYNMGLGHHTFGEANGLGAMLSLYIRDKEHRRGMSSLEAW